MVTHGSSGGRLLAAVATWVAGSIACGYATVWITRAVAPNWASDPNQLAVLIIAEVYTLLIAALVLTFHGRQRLRAALALGPTGSRAVVAGVAAWAAAYGIAFVGYGIVGLFESPDPSVSDVLLGIGSDNGRLADAGLVTAVLILLRACLLAPIGEEFLFRGAVFGWLRRRLRPGTTIALTAAGWTLIHQVPVLMPLAFTVGVAAGWVRERSGSVRPLIIAHVLQNVIIVIVAWVLTGWTAPLPV